METLTGIDITQKRLASLQLTNTQSSWAFAVPLALAAVFSLSPGHVLSEGKGGARDWLINKETQSTSRGDLALAIGDEIILHAMVELYQQLQAAQRSLDPDAEKILYENLWSLYE